MAGLPYHTPIRLITKVYTIAPLDLLLDCHLCLYIFSFYKKHTNQSMENWFWEIIINLKNQYPNYYNNYSVTSLTNRFLTMLSKNPFLFENKQTIYLGQYSALTKILLYTKNYWL